MKKKLILFVTMATVIFSTNVYASEVNLSDMSLEQLIDLRTEINVLIAEQGGDNIIGQGTYEVGVDIESGTYDIICSKNAQNGFINVETYPSKEDYENNEHREVSQIYYKEEASEAASINLKEGNILKLSGEGIIQATAPSWAVN
ncbi:MAG: hypothetical protein Q4F83_05060 [Eubacteriales bacterium]|nr:hypothetical protein [Eubacteriales bacterium]